MPQTTQFNKIASGPKTKAKPGPVIFRNLASSNKQSTKQIIYQSSWISERPNSVGLKRIPAERPRFPAVGSSGVLSGVCLSEVIGWRLLNSRRQPRTALEQG
jgi:hypothetical protein